MTKQQLLKQLKFEVTPQEYALLSEGKENEKMENISLCGKLEAVIGGYYLAFAGIPNTIEVLYYDSSATFGAPVEQSKKNLVAYFLDDEKVAFVRSDMLAKLKADTKEYDIIYYPVDSLEEELLSREQMEPFAKYLKDVVWIDDDFMRDERLPFDQEAFLLIDSGIDYLNPKHFSVEQLVDVLETKGRNRYDL